jgi:Uncharacterised protein family (UPF0158)
MPATVRLKDIVEALEMQSDEALSFLHLDTGQVQTVSRELMREAEESPKEEEPDLPEWQRPEWELVRQIVVSSRFIRLPTKFDVHEWAIMRDFADSMEPARIREDLQFAIHGAGAFRHFKRTLERYHVEPAWYRFRDEALREIAIEWCEENRIPWN